LRSDKAGGKRHASDERSAASAARTRGGPLPQGMSAAGACRRCP